MPWRISGGAPWEAVVGYSRAVVVPEPDGARRVLVSGCTSVVDGVPAHEGDAYRQALTALEVAERALAQAGGTLDDVVRTRLFVVGREHADEVGRAHAAAFGQVRPAASMLLVAGLIDPRLVVEIEVEAFVPAAD